MLQLLIFWGIMCTLSHFFCIFASKKSKPNNYIANEQESAECDYRCCMLPYNGNIVHTSTRNGKQ